MRLRIPKSLLVIIGIACWLGALVFLTYPRIFVEVFADAQLTQSLSQISTSPQDTKTGTTSDKVLAILKPHVPEPVSQVAPVSNPQLAFKPLVPQLQLPATTRSSDERTGKHEHAEGHDRVDPERALVQQSVEKWQAAWQAQDVTIYVGQYVEGFQPSTDQSHQAWLQDRQEKLTRPKTVKIELADRQLKRLDTHRWTFTFVQHYQSDRYQDIVRKELTLIKIGDQYLIEKERLR